MTEVDRLKRKAKRLYLTMRRELGTGDCGISLLSFIRPSFGRTVADFDATMAQLRRLDPNAPR